MKHAEIAEELALARANYWIIAPLCGVSLALLLRETVTDALPGYLLAYGLGACVSGFYSLRLSARISGIKAGMKKKRFPQ